ncbi:hypothetical protein ACFLZV_03000 [Candidatus Margulisiibacteriota bacterium]
MNFKDIGVRELAEYVGKHLHRNDVEAVLVGGACVSIYTENKYMSYDLDFITYETMRKVKKILEGIGFVYDDKKYFIHKDCKFFLEFVSPPIAIGDEPVTQFKTLKSNTGAIKILTPTDCVKDRLAAYIHWDDEQSLEQALMVAKNQKIDISNIKYWAKKEPNGKKTQEFFNRLGIA